MQLDGTRALVIGATGALGTRISHALYLRGARLMITGRDQTRLSDLSTSLAQCPTQRLDVLDDFDPNRVIDRAVDELGGLNLVVLCLGVAAFGPAHDTDPAVREELLRVNLTAPMELISAAVARFDGTGTVAALSAILADYPTAGMAAYSASKSALSAWLSVLRHEQRRNGLAVFDIRPQHMDTGLVDRALAGTAPRMPEPLDPDTVVERIVEGLSTDARELRYDLTAGQLALR